ncbi:MAG: shikimate dehydrogenase [Acidimicrobiaceae bacterium]|nr:shikimate dehydrogenase [Acidimicrobiaceae bacterium]
MVGVIGDPVDHSLSPVLHNAAFDALGMDWVYVAFPVRAGSGRAAVDAVRAMTIEGLSVTMPHKEDVARGVDRLSPTAERLGAVNTVVRRKGRLWGESTDGAGFLAALRLEGFEPSGQRCAVLGAGGAARAVVLALAEAGAEVAVVGRTPSRVEAAAQLGGRAGDWGDVSGAALVVNATPVGMTTGGMTTGGLPVEPALLGAGQVVVDLVYRPAVTELMTEARARGAVAHNGLGMLIHQAARQFELWTGSGAPLAIMRAAVTEGD